VSAGRGVREIPIINKRGLHARLGEIRSDGRALQCRSLGDARRQTVGGTSIMGLMMLSAGPDHDRRLRDWPRRPRPPSLPSPNWSPASSTKKAPDPLSSDAFRNFKRWLDRDGLTRALRTDW
jgi:hypothetical protein